MGEAVIPKPSDFAVCRSIISSNRIGTDANVSRDDRVKRAVGGREALRGPPSTKQYVAAYAGR